MHKITKNRIIFASNTAVLLPLIDVAFPIIKNCNMNTIKIGVLAGSARKGSFSRKVAYHVSGLMPKNFEMLPIEAGNLALFNQDFDDENRTPKEWTEFRESIKIMDGYLFVTPEYNRTFPPLLKNALDIASRPYGHSAWSGKPGAVISVSVGKMGGFGANHALRQAMVYLNIPLLQQPEVYLADVASLFDANGKITSEGTERFLADFAQSFAAWITKIRS
jgi:chromate reductase